MPIMTLPAWVFILSVGIPTAVLVMLVIALLRRKRKPHPQPAALNAPSCLTAPMFGQRVQQHVLAQQIDAIFNALVAVVEAEKIKLKALVLYAAPEAAPSKSGQSAGYSDMQPESKIAGEEDTGRTAAVMASDGMQPDQIARVLGLSHHEVALALKLRGMENKRLEAMA